MKILIIKLDKIGDYILFRNFLKPVRKKYPRAEITLLGNEVYKNLVDEKDDKFINKFLWANQKSFLTKNDYRMKYSIGLNKKYDLIIHPTYSRDRIVDGFIGSLKSDMKISFKGNCANQNKKEKKFSDLVYDRLIETNKLHDFDKNRDFFEKVLKMNLGEIILDLDYKKYKSGLIGEREYIVVMQGAGSRFRRYSKRKIRKIVQFIKGNYKLDVCLVGSKRDEKVAKEIKEKVGYNVLDLTGETDLNELVDLIGNAKFMISGDTCGLHIAVATKTPIICIATGIVYGRFIPYPKEYENVYPIFPPFWFKDFYGIINLINPKEIINKIKFLLK